MAKQEIGIPEDCSYIDKLNDQLNSLQDLRVRYKKLGIDFKLRYVNEDNSSNELGVVNTESIPGWEIIKDDRLDIDPVNGDEFLHKDLNTALEVGYRMLDDAEGTTHYGGSMYGSELKIGNGLISSK